MSEAPRPPFTPFDAAGASKKARAAEDAWNSRDPQRVSLAYTTDSAWRNRAEFFSGREAIVQFLTRKWAKELDYLASINDLPIPAADRKFHWPAGPRPPDHPGLGDLGL